MWLEHATERDQERLLLKPLVGGSFSAATVLCIGPEAEVTEELCEGGGLVVGVEAAGVGEDPGVTAAERDLLEADASVFDAATMR